MAMPDEEIIKALECCCGTAHDSCRDCPYDDIGCEDKLEKDVFDLIKRKDAEIERLQIRNDELNNLNKTVSQEVIKGFAHLLIDKAKRGVIYAMDIPDYVKEMVGD